MKDARELALWTGLAGGVQGLGIMVAGPIWGVVADRFGRKAMLMRALLGTGLAMALLSLARTPLEVVGLRFIWGTVGGSVPLVNAIVSAETPREFLAWAIGVVNSSVAFGGAIGPFAGSLAIAAVGLRPAFILAGIMVSIASLPLILVVREASTRVETSRLSPLTVLRAAPRDTLRVISALIACQALYTISQNAIQPLVVLKLLAESPSQASLLTGIAFGLSGITTAIAAATYSRVVLQSGYRRVAGAAALVLAFLTTGLAIADVPQAMVPMVALMGLMGGVVSPALWAMVGLEAPTDARATVFGASSSALGLGLAVGPLIGGGIAATAGIEVAITTSATMLVLLALVLRLAVRDPVV